MRDRRRAALQMSCALCRTLFLTDKNSNTKHTPNNYTYECCTFVIILFCHPVCRNMRINRLFDKDSTITMIVQKCVGAYFFTSQFKLQFTYFSLFCTYICNDFINFHLKSNSHKKNC